MGTSKLGWPLGADYSTTKSMHYDTVPLGRSVGHNQRQEQTDDDSVESGDEEKLLVEADSDDAGPSQLRQLWKEERRVSTLTVGSTAASECLTVGSTAASYV